MKRKIWNICLALAFMITACFILQCATVQAAVKKPSKAEISKVVSTAPEKLTIKWKKTPKAGKYQIQVALDKKFTINKMSKTVSAKKQKCVFKNLWTGTKYFVRVRACRVVSGKKYYGKWSASQSVRIKNYTVDSDEDSDYDTDFNPEEDDDLDTENQPQDIDISPDENTNSDTSIKPDKDVDKDKNTGSDTEKKVYLSSAGYSVKIDGETSFVYTGEEFRPKVTVSGEGLASLVEGTDYDVAYENNVNAGTADIIVTGKGKYEGKLTTTFRITLADADFQAKLSSDVVYVGETIKLEYTGHHGEVKLSNHVRGIAEVDADGTIRGLKPGCTYINVSVKSDGNHKGYSEIVGPVLVSKKEPTSFSLYTGKDFRTDDGGCTFVRYLNCDAAAVWLEDVEYEVTDVTPPIWKKVYEDLGVQFTTPTLTATNEQEPKEKWQGEQTLTIHAGPGTRAVHVVAKKNGAILREQYLQVECRKTSSGGQQDFSEWDIEMYRRVRQKVESKIWTDDMTTHQKLKAVEDYLNSVLHYPSTSTTSKEYNPTYYAQWEIPGEGSMYKGTGPDGLMMCYVGGMSDCWTGATLLERVAGEDLGLTYLDDETQPGEGFWIVQGKGSSAPNNPYHRTFRYRDAQGQGYGYDVQGMIFKSDDPMVTCENHDCNSKIISLRD